MTKHSSSPYSQLGTGFSEHNDCAVRAAATAGNLPYEKVRAVFAKHGRKPRGLTYLPTSVAAHRELFQAERVTVAGNLSLAEFTRRYPTGRFIIDVRRHALAVIDGVIHDWSPKPRRQVIRYWKLPERAEPVIAADRDAKLKLIELYEAQNALLRKKINLTISIQ